MSNTQAMCTSFKQDILNGLHALGASVIRAATTKDVFNAALFLVTATINAATTAYAPTGELAATGNYVAGGQAITNGTAPTTTTTIAFWTPSASLVWSALTSSGAFDTVLVYNATAAGKNAVSVHTFGSQSVTAGNFTLTMPANAAATALIQIA
jgi:hypothetical protein